ncbi:phosphate ABC transporter substrate-binding protein PstS [Candidatus Methylocalor cossyra]|uniref:phosphate ABC transporter substrate-binding protein PstS n=1 Tax=Candidatus Methylocalor cossyra TaxID=3108543 RepID=UPI0032B25C13
MAATAAELALRGAGATFPAPLYKKWIEVYGKQNPRVAITYEAVGSGEGIRRFLAEQVDFAGSDAALSDEQIAQVARGVRMIPVTAGLVVLAYNLPGLTGPLKLSREAYVDILAGRIRRWNDPRIQATNPHLTLPNLGITLVARLDSSGTTFALTNHLSAVSAEWRDRGPGAAKVVDWPGNAMRVPYNEGVASRIKLSEGSIGYVEYGFAKRLGLPMAWLQNKAGQFVEPNDDSGQEALSSHPAPWPENLRLFIPDPGGAGSYPIVTFTWLLLYGHYPDPERAAQLKRFVAWGLDSGQTYGRELGYIPLAPELAAQCRAALEEVR